MAEKKKKLKKIVRNKSKQRKFFEKYGIALILFFILSFLYLTWIYAVPAILKQTITEEKINKFVATKIGFKSDFNSVEYYTTPTLAIGAKFKDVRVVFPEYQVSDNKGLLFKARVVSMEIPVIPLLMKTIKFDELSLRTATINLYQNEYGQFVFLQTLKTNFNPKMKKYILEVPDINIYSYAISNYNSKTDVFKKERGSIKTIKAFETKEVLQNTANPSIMLR